jgi:hypothetical protein
MTVSSSTISSYETHQRLDSPQQNNIKLMRFAAQQQKINLKNALA